MKAQSLRRLLAFANVALTLGVVGTAGWWWFKVRPAAADEAKRGAWVKAADEAYKSEAANAKPTPTWSVNEEDLKWIVRPDLMDRKRGPGVWPFVGPVPPKPEPKKVDEGPKAEPPKGLAAIGKLASAFLTSGDAPSVITFFFNASKRKRSFAVGDLDPIEDADPKAPKDEPVRVADGTQRRPGKYLVAVSRVADQGDDPQVKVVYDEYVAGDKPPERKEEVLTLAQDLSTSRPVFSDTAPGADPAARATASGPADRPPPRSDVKITPVRTPEGRYRVELDDASHRYFRFTNVDDLTREVGTEDVKDAQGGIRVTKMEPGSVVSQFDIQPGDIVRSIDGKPTPSRNAAVEVVKAISPDAPSVTVVVEKKSGEMRTYEVDPRDPKVRGAAGRAKFK
ncbi:MAG: hypothetical protein IT460_00755 [Planctomycetes bacterium]|nr:hypothetical protein [Planctomycetota bacterium]